MKRRSMTMKRKQRIFDAHQGICHICGDPVEFSAAEFDHVIPLALNGCDEDADIAPAHKACHADKTKGDVRIIAKAKRVHKKHNNLITRRKAIIPGSKASGWKKPLNKPAERRATRPTPAE